jgi:hypothetical protein
MKMTWELTRINNWIIAHSSYDEYTVRGQSFSVENKRKINVGAKSIKTITSATMSLEQDAIVVYVFLKKPDDMIRKQFDENSTLEEFMRFIDNPE